MAPTTRTVKDRPPRKLRPYQEIAARIERSIREDPSYELGSILELADEFGVSYQTMWKALHTLSVKGVVVSASGRRNRIAPGLRPQGDASGAPASSIERLYNLVKQRIAAGAYQVGRYFPKIGFFALSESVSPVTVTRVFMRLSREGLAHKQRRRWIVGPRPATPAGAGSMPAPESPVVLVSIIDERDWATSFQSDFTNSFMLSMRNELSAHSMYLSPAFRRRLISPSLLTVPWGLDQARARIAELGPRYGGALVLCVVPDDERISEWVSMLNSHDKPVVYFDSTDVGAEVSRKGLPRKRTYFRLHLDEMAAARLALDALARRGHRVIGVHGWQKFAWCRRRLDNLIACAAEHPQHPEIVTAEPPEDIWGFMKPSYGYFDGSIKTTGLHDVIDNVARGAGLADAVGRPDPRRMERLREVLVAQTRSMVSLFRDKKATALASLNDDMAREHYFWARAMGIDVPSDLSIVSFDNTPPSSFFPISTIDFGFARLGYLAAHIFIGDLTVTPDRKGSIPGVCALADRGSIAAPGDPSRLAHILGSGTRVGGR